MTLLAALPTQATLLDAVVASISSAAQHNPNDTLPPDVVLWPDKEWQCEPVLPALRVRLPLLTLGAYDPETLTGPAYWLRCAIAGTLDGVTFTEGATPVIYLPGVSRTDLRAVESCPKELQPLAELQYRGVIWSHRNGRDWTVGGFLRNPDARLEITVQGDAATETALLSGLRRLAQEPVASLRAAQPLRAAYIHDLLNPDAGRRLLRWLNDPDQERQTFAPEEWQAFVATCQETYGFHPERDGAISATRKLGDRKGSWKPLWELFSETPDRYAGIAARLEQAQPYQQPSLFEDEPIWKGHADPRSSWPGANQAAENILRDGLRASVAKPAADARTDLLQLEAEHGARRDWVWAKLGAAPLAMALEPLAELAARTAKPLAGKTSVEMTQVYADEGWRTDDAFLRTLASVADAAPDDADAVLNAADVVYRPWLEDAATRFQIAVLCGGDGEFDYATSEPIETEPGTCLMFVDGLRFDLGQELAEHVRAMGYEVATASRLAALPTVTPTAKAAVAPVADQLDAGEGFETVVAADGRRVTSSLMNKLLAEAGYDVLSGSDLGNPTSRAWTVEGQIDPAGHNLGWMVAKHGRDEVIRLAGRIRQLLTWGWQEIVVVTDHGWLLLPGKLPTAELRLHLTEIRKGRCARLKDGVQTEETKVPWHWDATVRVAVASGIRCYEAGKVYEHGGLSPQECITLVIRVRSSTTTVPVQILELRWRGLRCNVTLSGATSEMVVDLRLSPADQASSVANSTKSPDPDGTATLFLDGERDDLAETEAYVTVTAPDGTVLAQQHTMIGV